MKRLEPKAQEVQLHVLQLGFYLLPAEPASEEVGRCRWIYLASRIPCVSHLHRLCHVFVLRFLHGVDLGVSSSRRTTR